jgi:hypothetical protein
MPNRFAVGSLFLGAALTVTGFALIYHPLGFIVAGLFLLSAAFAKRSK